MSIVERLTRQPRLHSLGRALVVRAVEQFNYQPVRGMVDAEVRPDYARFSRAAPWTITQDYVRDGTLALMCREIEELAVPGALAELGVFRGDFAWLMSTYLPERRIHLFDTFQGFDEAEFRRDEQLVERFVDFSATDPVVVRARFARPELVSLHVGRFPETADGLEERFSLVSIDADLYEPVLSGLRWFFARLSPGGAIMVHDFNNREFGGAKRAVREFQTESRMMVVALPDWGGSAVIVKPRGQSDTGSPDSTGTS
jgi:O-methyltransferase